MKNILYLLGLILVALLIISCAGHDDDEDDIIPPVNQILVPHLGDTGDPPVIYQGQTVYLNDDVNGIDTVPDEDWIRISWGPFMDNDLSHVKVYRYDEFHPTPVIIDSIAASVLHYLDADSNLTERVWYSYFTDLVDTSGNVARSDTVTYALLSKSILLTPENNATISPVGARFYWNRSGFASKYRVLLFDENYNYVWHQDLYVALEEDPLEMIIPVTTLTQYAGQSLRWRVDSFDWDENKQMYMGSESYERVFHVQ